MMSGSDPTQALLFSLLCIFSISSFQLNYSFQRTANFCPEIEKQTLLSFKQSMENPNNELMSSWDGEVNCCKWKGVSCNNLTGHVDQLHLRNIHRFVVDGLKGKLNSSLLNLKYLRYLDLSENDMLRGTIPSFIGSFAKLEYLDLSHTGFHGKIPHTLGNLSNLHTLHLYAFFGSNLFVDSLEWLSQLSQLKNLTMAGVNLIKAKNWAHVINSLPSLVQLDFDLCELHFVDPLRDFNITTSLKHLHIVMCNHQPSTIPKWIFQLSSLLTLDLSSNNFIGPIPTVSNATRLNQIVLSHNDFNSSIPDWLYLCKELEFVDLSENHLSGTISNSIKTLTSLNTFIVSYNQLSGNLPESLGQVINLQQLEIDFNILEGVVNETHFAGLTKLEGLIASENKLTLKVSPNWNPPFQLTTLKLASLNVGSLIPPWIETQKDISFLDLSNTGISGNIPSWVWKIQVLRLSNNHFHGEIPDLVIGPKDRSIHLDSNKFHGSLPRIAGTVRNLFLFNNLLSGGISHLLCDMENETSGLLALHLGGNQLSEELPDCWMKWPSLKYLNLSSNAIFGSIPNSIGYLAKLKTLSLNENRLSGELPFSLRNCTHLRMINLANNLLEGRIPAWVGTDLIELIFLILRSNKFGGNISSEICHLNSLQILDFSDNKLSGIIPRCFYNFTAMATKRHQIIYVVSNEQTTFAQSASVVIKGSDLEYKSTLSLLNTIDMSRNNLSGDIPKELTSLVELRSLNLSQNRLTGSIPEKIGDMKQLESLDFSMNSLSGKIPNSMALMSFLNYFNVSYNKLTGEIPKSTQLASLDASGFIGNSLCGPPLTSNCSRDGDEVHGQKEENDEDEIEWIYVLVSLGYAVGLSGVCSALVLNKFWREAYFKFLDSMWDKLYVYVCIKFNRLSGC